jgi:hypothetical protein
VSSSLKARVAGGLAIAGLALAIAPIALADPVPNGPAEGATFTARGAPLSFEASTAVVPAPGRMDFYVSRDSQPGSDGVLSNPIDSFFAGPAGTPTSYTATPGSDVSWPNKPGTYYWQAVYHDCVNADPNCAGPIRSFILDALPAPKQVLPADDATIPFAGRRTFSIRDAPSYSHDGTRLNIEFSSSPQRAADGTFADPLQIARPQSAGGDLYEYLLHRPFTNRPGTYYWIAERFDCAAEPDPDCFVTSGVRSFTIREVPPGTAPNTVLKRHPGHRTHKRKIRFRFGASLPGASFQCFYTGGWTRCDSPEIFRHLKPGRYRFKVRAVLDGKKDQTPIKWLFRVVRRR